MGIPTFVLASASTARRQLLETIGIVPVIQPSHFDEDSVPLTEPQSYVETLARCKAEIVAAQFDRALVLGCDSILAVRGEIHGKPQDAEEALARWQAMRGQIGELHTGHVLIDRTQGKTLVRSRMTQVHFAQASDRQIRAYIATAEPLRCAGAFAIDGKGSLFVEKIVGCHTNVIGLSLPLLREMMAELGYDATDYWR
ncbi:MAG: septum formation inhibitor Maf [Coleofasciculaceae cyanobacterium SM2_3_26]|nr:septum formation inhibitor Maf [Coleofasciculaceae cyanobacterium SM2_3_26]